MARLGSWIEPFPEGIYVKPADAWVDPSQPKARALVTHGHADHARGGHGAVWATAETLAIMGVRYGEQQGHPVTYGESVKVGDVEFLRRQVSVERQVQAHPGASTLMVVHRRPPAGPRPACR